MLHIKFEYRDKFTHGEWRKQECIVSSMDKCKEIYGLGTDPGCEYHIISVRKI